MIGFIRPLPALVNDSKMLLQMCWLSVYDVYDSWGQWAVLKVKGVCRDSDDWVFNQLALPAVSRVLASLPDTTSITQPKPRNLNYYKFICLITSRPTNLKKTNPKAFRWTGTCAHNRQMQRIDNSSNYENEAPSHTVGS